jgi:hypothetical protein
MISPMLLNLFFSNGLTHSANRLSHPCFSLRKKDIESITLYKTFDTLPKGGEFEEFHVHFGIESLAFNQIF